MKLLKLNFFYENQRNLIKQKFNFFFSSMELIKVISIKKYTQHIFVIYNKLKNVKQT